MDPISILKVLLSVHEPLGNTVSNGVSHNVLNHLAVLFRQLSSSKFEEKDRSLMKKSHLLLGSILAILQMRCANLRPIPLIVLKP